MPIVGECSVCHRRVAVNWRGVVTRHLITEAVYDAYRAAGRSVTREDDCPGSGQPPVHTRVGSGGPMRR